jgi:hypothetical protein
MKFGLALQLRGKRRVLVKRFPYAIIFDVVTGDSPFTLHSV